MPVKIFYFTASAFEGEQFHFLPDVYDRDAKVLAELNEPFSYVARRRGCRGSRHDAGPSPAPTAAQPY